MRCVMKLLWVWMWLIMTQSVVLADTRTDVGMTFGSEGLRSFYLAIGEYYRVPERQVVYIRERHIPDYDIPVVLFIADRARVAPEVVIDYRSRGRSWMDVSLHFGLGPDVYYVPVKQSYGPPYGHAYGHYKNKHSKNIRLSDADVVNMVNLRFMSEHYGYEPERVIRMRSSGKNFVTINEEIRRGGKDMDKYERQEEKSRGKHDQKEMKAQQKEQKGHGNGKNKNRDD